MGRLTGRLLELFDSQARRHLLGLGVLLVLNGFAEMVSLGLILPFLALAADEGRSLAAHPRLAALVELVGGPSSGLVMGVGLAIGVVFLARNVFLAFVQHRQQEVVWGIRAEVAGRFFREYLRQPYVDRLERGTPLVLRNLTSSLNEVFTGMVLPLVQLAGELVLIATIGILLLAVSPGMTLLAGGIFTLAVAGMQRLASRRLARWGAVGAQSQKNMIAAVTQGLEGIREIKVMGREEFFARRFERACADYSSTKSLSSTLSQLPRMALETLAIWAVVGVVVAVVAGGGRLADQLPLLGLFGVAALRFVPGFSRINQHLNNLRLNTAVLDALHADLEAFRANRPEPASVPLPFTHSIAFEDVSFAYPGRGDAAVSHLNFTIAKGESVAFVGASGSGKTTVLGLILGLLNPATGIVRVDGTDIAGRHRAWQDHLSLIPQEVFLIDGTLRDNIVFGDSSPVDEGRLLAAVRAAQLEPVVARLPEGLASAVGERGGQLSGGERQRVGLARAFYADADVVVLDEATSALDAVTEAAVTRTLRELKGAKTVLVVAHRLSTVAHCDRLFFMERGRIVDSGRFDELIQRNAAFAELVHTLQTTGGEVHA
jgi:ABC-type multidrug transport system, ATPase and permease components